MAVETKKAIPSPVRSPQPTKDAEPPAPKPKAPAPPENRRVKKIL